MYEYNCQKCGGFVGEPMKPYGYAGQWCHCEIPQRPTNPPVITTTSGTNPMKTPEVKESKCYCERQTTFGNADVEIGGICHRKNQPCYNIDIIKKGSPIPPLEVGENIIVCPCHGNEKYGVRPPHYCKTKVREGCNCVCTCPPLEVKEGSKDIEWADEFELGGEFVDLEGDFRPSGIRKIVPFINSLLSQQEAKIEHCAEPDCPECNLVAYERGIKDGEAKIKRELVEGIDCYDFKENHICGFNDGKQNCRCFLEGLKVAKDIIK